MINMWLPCMVNVAQSWNRFGDTGILPAGDQIRDALERDPGWPSHLASHWSTGIQWPWWPPWWLDSHDDTLGRDSSIKGKGLLLPKVISCWICSSELQSMLLRRYWTWRAMSFATRLLVAAPTETVAWVHPNFWSSRTSDWSAQQGTAQLVARSAHQQLAQLYLLEQLHQWPECPTRSSPTGSKEHPLTVNAVVYITVPTCRHGLMTLVTKELYLHIHWIKPWGYSLLGKNIYGALSIIIPSDQIIPKLI